MQSRTKQTIFFLAKLLLSIGVLFYIVHGRNLKQLESNLLEVEPSMFLLALVLVGVQTVILNGRWMLIMRSLGVMIDWLAGLRILLISLWFNQVLPSSAGGDVVRIWLLRRRDVPWPEAVKGVMADRFTALLGIVVLMVVGFPVLCARVDNPPALLAIGALAAAGAFGTLVLLTLDRWPARLIALRPIASFVRFGTLVRFLLLQFPQRGVLFGSAILIHVMTAASCYILALGLHAQLSALDAFILIPPVILLTAVPVSISGWGVREGAMVACLGLVGVSSTKALAVSLLSGAISVIIGLVGGVVWLTSPERGNYAEAQAAAATDDPGASGPLEMQGSP